MRQALSAETRRTPSAGRDASLMSFLPDALCSIGRQVLGVRPEGPSSRALLLRAPAMGNDRVWALQARDAAYALPRHVERPRALRCYPWMLPRLFSEEQDEPARVLEWIECGYRDPS